MSHEYIFWVFKARLFFLSCYYKIWKLKVTQLLKLVNRPRKERVKIERLTSSVSYYLSYIIFLCCVFCTITCLFAFLFLAMALSVIFQSMSLTVPEVSFVPLLHVNILSVVLDRMNLYPIMSLYEGKISYSQCFKKSKFNKDLQEKNNINAGKTYITNIKRNIQLHYDQETLIHMCTMCAYMTKDTCVLVIDF